MCDRGNNDEKLKILAQAWSLRPHLRLGQLIYNALSAGERSVSLHDYEDDDLITILAAYCDLELPTSSRNDAVILPSEGWDVVRLDARTNRCGDRCSDTSKKR